MSLVNRRTFINRLARLSALPLACGGGTFAYASLLARHRVRVERHEIALALGERAPARLRVLALGDLHFDPLFEIEYLAKCVAMANDLKPDVIILTGDFVTSSTDRMGELAELLARFSPRDGVFACLGNHDQWLNAPRVTAGLKSRGVEVLVNQQTRIACGGGELVVAGLQSAWGGRPDWPAASRGLRGDERAIVVMHEPDFAQLLREDPRIALQLSGHTHGGQVRIPLVGALRLPLWGRIYQAGLYDVDGLKLHVNRGIGTIQWHVRFFCPPEIACLDITNSGASSARSTSPT